MALAESVYDELTKECPALKTEVVIDDRLHMSIGQRLNDAHASGYPHAIVLGKKVSWLSLSVKWQNVVVELHLLIMLWKRIL